MKRILLTILTVTALALAVTGCNTVEGAGEDIESAGDEVQDWTK